jgi:hypothetical protein
MVSRTVNLINMDHLRCREKITLTISEEKRSGSLTFTIIKERQCALPQSSPSIFKSPSNQSDIYRIEESDIYDDDNQAYE